MAYGNQIQAARFSSRDQVIIVTHRPFRQPSRSRATWLIQVDRASPPSPAPPPVHRADLQARPGCPAASANFPRHPRALTEPGVRVTVGSSNDLGRGLSRRHRYQAPSGSGSRAQWSRPTGVRTETRPNSTAVVFCQTATPVCAPQGPETSTPMTACFPAQELPPAPKRSGGSRLLQGHFDANGISDQTGTIPVALDLH